MTARKFYSVLAGLLGLLLVGGLLSFWLVHRRLDSRIAGLRRLSADVALANDQLERLRKLQSEYEQIRPLAQKASSVLPAQKEQDKVVAQVAKIVAQSGLALTGLDFDKTSGLPNEKSQTQASSIGGIFVMPVRFQTEGSYRQVQSLLSRFERQQRFTRVTTLDLTRQPSGRIAVSITLEVFFKP